MPRYLVESEGAPEQRPASRGEGEGPLERDRLDPVTWIFSFVGADRTFALFDGPHPEAVRRAARESGLSIDRLSEVRLLDPYSYPTGHGDDR